MKDYFKEIKEAKVMLRKKSKDYKKKIFSKRLNNSSRLKLMRLSI